MTRLATLFAAAVWLIASGWGPSAEPLLIDVAALPHKPSEVTAKNKGKVPAGAVELVVGQFGKACKFSFVESTGPQFFTAWVNPQEDWNQYEGFSFWVKGDGSRNCGGLEFIDRENFALRYGYCFPIKSTGWTKISVAWSDLIPELAGPPVDAHGGFAPNRFRNVWFGKWFYWREYPACSFAIERMQLEKKIERDAADYTPQKPGLPRVLAKLKARQPITIVTMGDSLSDKRHWANRETLWSELLVKNLKDTYGGEVTLVNPAIGGTTLSQNVVLVPRWLQDAPAPDLVTIWFGGNDWDTGVRGPRYQQYLRAAIDRVRRLTKGQAELLVMTTCPGFNAWETTSELSQAAWAVAKEQKTGFADAASAFHQAGSREEALKRKYWVWDNVHLGPGGHELIAETVLRAIQSEGLADLRTAADAYWTKVAPSQQVAEGETPLSSFEPGHEKLVSAVGGQVAQEHATEGRHALRLQSKEKDYVSISLEDGRSLRLARENSRFLVDVFNPQDRDVTVGVLVKDPQSKDYNSRHNGALTVKLVRPELCETGTPWGSRID
jgi:lysophospholipase L1-like esterase